MFRFKQFAIEQQRCAMKVGTDGVLLGAWCDLDKADRRILDIGTGTGVIALMAAQRCPWAQVTAVDIDDDCASQAQANIDASPWSDRVAAVCGDIRSFESDVPFDHIISNPPYFTSSLLPPDRARSVARHCTELSFAEIVAAADRLLSDSGRMSLILPRDAADELVGLCRGRFVVRRRCDVRTTPVSTIKRSMLELGRPSHWNEPYRCRELVIQSAHEVFTDDYKRLTRDFYLKF
ncbi:MAG: methyltransferase [Alistipes sp.]|nr:methyltransferase [Alistipes sp.]